MRNCSDARVFVGLGCNAGRCEEVLNGAIGAVATLAVPHTVRRSAYYDTAPQHRVDQADFVNAVVEFRTTLAPSALLAGLNRIEQHGGRDRSRESRYGPRTIDLDLLLYDALVIRSDRLIVPHPFLHRRAFALIPLLELWPGAYDPRDGHRFQDDVRLFAAQQRVVRLESAR